MKIKFFLFIFLFLFIHLVIADSPQQIKAYQDLYLGSSSNSHLYGNDYFTNYDCIYLIYQDSFRNISHGFPYRCYGDAQYCYTDAFTVCLIPSSNNFDISITGTDTNSIITISTLVFNATNSSDYLNPFFTVYSNESTSFSEGRPLDDGFFGSLSNGLLNLYPSSSSLSSSSKFSYVFVTVLFWFLIYYGIIYFLTKGNTSRLSSFFHYIFFMICIVLFFLFVSINYIPIGILIFIVLVLAVLAFFRFKSGFSSGGK